jgi:hypothetical protein
MKELGPMAVPGGAGSLGRVSADRANRTTSELYRQGKVSQDGGETYSHQGGQQLVPPAPWVEFYARIDNRDPETKAYAWSEVLPEDGGDWASPTGGYAERFGTLTFNQAFEANETVVPTGTIVRMRPGGVKQEEIKDENDVLIGYETNQQYVFFFRNCPTPPSFSVPVGECCPNVPETLSYTLDPHCMVSEEDEEGELVYDEVEDAWYGIVHLCRDGDENTCDYLIELKCAENQEFATNRYYLIVYDADTEEAREAITRLEVESCEPFLVTFVFGLGIHITITEPPDE